MMGVTAAAAGTVRINMETTAVAPERQDVFKSADSRLGGIEYLTCVRATWTEYKQIHNIPRSRTYSRAVLYSNLLRI